MSTTTERLTFVKSLSTSSNYISPPNIFQPAQLCTQLKIMKALEDDTEYKMKTLRESDLDVHDLDAVRQKLKDRQHGNDFIDEVEDGQKKTELYIKALEREITKRRQVVELLTHGNMYYKSLLDEATIVATVRSHGVAF